MISDQQYLNWQKKLAENKFFRWFWAFWGMYAILFYGIFAICILISAGKVTGFKILIMATIAGLFNEFVVSKIIHLFHRKPHPYQRLQMDTLSWWLMSLKDDVHDSFPSEHASTTAAISMVIFLFFPFWGWLVLILPVIIAMGRIVLGYHEIVDVVWGYAIGLLSGYFAYLFLLPRLFTP